MPVQQRTIPLSEAPPPWRLVLSVIAIGKVTIGGAGLGMLLVGLFAIAATALDAELASGYAPLQAGAAIGAAAGLLFALDRRVRGG